MTITTLPVSDEYINPGVTVIHWLLAIADVNAPTKVELGTATDLTCQVQAADGWELSAADVDNGDLCSDFASKAPGMRSTGDLSMTFRADKNGDDVRSVLSDGAAGYMAIYHGGLTGTLMDIFPARVKVVSKPIDVSGATVGRVVVGFSPTAKPAIDIDVPTTT